MHKCADCIHLLMKGKPHLYSVFTQSHQTSSAQSLHIHHSHLPCYCYHMPEWIFRVIEGSLYARGQFRNTYLYLEISFSALLCRSGAEQEVHRGGAALRLRGEPLRHG